MSQGKKKAAPARRSAPAKNKRATADNERGVGTLRLRGEVRGGAWSIMRSTPQVTAETLREALAFCAGVAGGREVHLRDEAQAEAFDAAVEDWSFLFLDEPVVDGLVRRLQTPDAPTLANIAARPFRAAFGETWPGESD